MIEIYGRDLDLNLLRVFAVVAESGSVTAAAKRLYLTQPALSAALARLARAVGSPLFVRQGRGLTLTHRGQRLLSRVRTLLPALVSAALSPDLPELDTVDRVLRLGLSDTAETWLLPPLLRALKAKTPGVRVVALPVQFRTVGPALASGAIELAVAVADELPAGFHRQALFYGDFVCLYDPRAFPSRSRRRGGLTMAAYFAAEHVVVSYNADLRGIVEDAVGRARRVRCSVSTFASIGALVDGDELLATVPRAVAQEIRRLRPHLAVSELPFPLAGSASELIWPSAVDDDPVLTLVRELVQSIARKQKGASRPPRFLSAGSGRQARLPPQ